MTKAYVIVIYDNDHQRDIIKMFKKLQYEQMIAVMEESNGITTWLQGMGMEIPQLPVDIADINIAQVTIYIPSQVAEVNSKRWLILQAKCPLTAMIIPLKNTTPEGTMIMTRQCILTHLMSIGARLPHLQGQTQAGCNCDRYGYA